MNNLFILQCTYFFLFLTYHLTLKTVLLKWTWFYFNIVFSLQSEYHSCFPYSPSDFRIRHPSDFTFQPGCAALNDGHISQTLYESWSHVTCILVHEILCRENKLRDSVVFFFCTVHENVSTNSHFFKKYLSIKESKGLKTDLSKKFPLSNFDFKSLKKQKLETTFPIRSINYFV